MPPYLNSPHVEISLRIARRESIHERRARYRGSLKITTPAVPEELHKKWHGMPPSRIAIPPRCGGPLAL